MSGAKTTKKRTTIITATGNVCRLGMKLGVDVTALVSAYTELIRLNSVFVRQGPAETMGDSSLSAVASR